MATDLETEWQLFKSGILEAAAECCGFKGDRPPSGSQRRSSWWIREVQLAVKEKKAVFKKWIVNKEPSTRVRYVKASKAGVKVVAKAKAHSSEKFGEMLESNFTRQTKYSGRLSAASEEKKGVVSES
ncbi:unnamed protein product [Soboliphyme baturini]|uniref:Signal recognition particle protein n=1 Tax=Soboliphyme baturini TaxID=241478 RepID=A0A183IXZ1_9BILA|nr:unnamed protein product [Soboliphyme baturini]